MLEIARRGRHLLLTKIEAAIDDLERHPGTEIKYKNGDAFKLGDLVASLDNMDPEIQKGTGQPVLVYE